MLTKFRRTRKEAVLPKYEHDGDSGMDIYSCEDCYLKPGERKLIPTGLKCEIQQGYELQVRPKSGLAKDHGITVLNTPGTIDAGYRGEIGIILYNAGQEAFKVGVGMKIAQLVLAKVEKAEIQEVGEVSQSERGEGAFGSTG